MDKYKLLKKLEQGKNNINFDFFIKVVEKFGFEKISKKKGGSHVHNYRHSKIQYKLILQSKNGQAKVYQIDQFLKLVKENNL